MSTEGDTGVRLTMVKQIQLYPNMQTSELLVSCYRY